MIFCIHVFLRFLHRKAICDVKSGIDQYIWKLTHGSKMTVSSFLLKIMWPNLSWKGKDIYLIKVDRFMWRNEKHLRKCYVLLMRKKKVRIDIVGVSINCGLKRYTWNFFSYEVQYISLASTFYFHRLVHFMILWGTAIFFVPVIFHYFYQFCMCISAWILWTLGNVLLKILHGRYFILYVLVSQYNVWLSLLLLSLLLLLLLLRMTFWMM